MQIRIGTSGWHYKHWIPRYDPEKMRPAEMLDYYLRDFDTVELNNMVNFVPRAQRLGCRLGPILWQLPPKWNVNVERLEEFLSKLPRGIRYAFELRNTTWMTDRVYEVLHKHNAAFCIYELAEISGKLQRRAARQVGGESRRLVAQARPDLCLL